MNSFIDQFFAGNYVLVLVIIIALAIWETVWKLIALWKSARKNQLTWFIVIAVFNTLGILPIIYLLLHRKKKGEEEAADGREMA